MFVYVNGDSFAKVSNGKVFADFLGDMLDSEYQNSAIRGSCNSRIFRTSLRDLLDLKQVHNDIVAVITLSFTIRTELWDEAITNNRFVNDGEFVSIQTTHSKTWVNDLNKVNLNKVIGSKYQDYADQWLRWYNVEAETVTLLQEILLFTTWCKHHNINYVIFSSCLQEPVDLESQFIKSIYQEVSKDPNVMNIFEQSFSQWCLSKDFVPINDYTQVIHGKEYKIGHHGEPAHKAFAEFLIMNYIKREKQ